VRFSASFETLALRAPQVEDGDEAQPLS